MSDVSNPERQRSRAEIADALERIDLIDEEPYDAYAATIADAAALLRQTCGGCASFQSNPVVTTYALCWKLKLHSHDMSGGVGVPADGSGFCHEWTPKAVSQ